MPRPVLSFVIKGKVLCLLGGGEVMEVTEEYSEQLVAGNMRVSQIVGG